LLPPSPSKDIQFSTYESRPSRLYPFFSSLPCLPISLALIVSPKPLVHRLCLISHVFSVVGSHSLSRFTPLEFVPCSSWLPPPHSSCLCHCFFLRQYLSFVSKCYSALFWVDSPLFNFSPEPKSRLRSAFHRPDLSSLESAFFHPPLLSSRFVFLLARLFFSPCSRASLFRNLKLRVDFTPGFERSLVSRVSLPP